MIFNPESLDDESRKIFCYFLDSHRILLEEYDVDPSKVAQCFFYAALITFADIRGIKGPEAIAAFYNGMLERHEANKPNLN